ncbi:MAG: tetratricopeptide repeat protein [Roseivirga sp.]|nr:tetratricopeptide repeat protein [Roseivirga sp.]
MLRAYTHFYLLWKLLLQLKKVQKHFTYKILLMMILLMLVTSVFAQKHREELREKLSESYTFIKENPQEAVKRSSDAYNMIKDIDDDYIKVIGLSGLGYVSYKVRDYESAYLNFTSALELYESLDTTDYQSYLSILQHLGMVHSKFSNYDSSIEYRKRSLKVAKDYNDKFPELAKEKGAKRLLNDIPYFLAVEYEKKGAHQTAGKMLMRLWEEAEDKEDIVTHARVLNKLGVIKKKNGEYREALEYFGLIVAEKEVSKKYKAMAYHNLAETYMVQGNYGKAESFYLNALDFKKEIGNARSTFITYQGLGELAYRKGNMLEAIKHWETGLSIFDKVEGEPGLYSIYNSLQLAYMDIDIEKAKTFNQTHMQLNDFYVRNQSLQREDDADKREALSMLIDKQRQKRIDAAQRADFIRQFWPVFLGVALLVLFSMILGVRYYMALKANKLLTSNQLKMQEAQAGSDTSEKAED